MRPMLPLILLLLACSPSEEASWRVAVELQFPLEPSAAPLVAAGADGQAIHWFEGNWGPNEPSGIWLLEDGGVLRVELPAVDTRLSLDIQTRPEVAAAGQTLTLLVNDVELTQLEIAPWGPPELQQFEIPAAWLSEPIDRIQFECSTHLEVDGEPAHAAFVRALKLEQLTEGQAAPAGEGWWDPATWAPVEVPAEPRSADAESPDILLIVLDAARADHFGSYGYGRDTTPFIDSLAEDGRILRNLHSVAPFTRSSMPTLLTGSPWFTHGMAIKKHTLAAEIPTMAELLAPMGYQRLGLSESPHVSFASGLDRGFDLFWETWKHPDREALAGPDMLVSLFAQMLEQGLDERPAFAFVHMIPPHVPYVPTPAFDLWTEDDPGRRRKTVGAHEMLAYRRGVNTLDERELRRLVALYDGNLRRADDLTEKLVRHWQSLGRTRPLRILITSDHGEALGEHDMYGHNVSLFTVMTHIPGILWPREAFEELEGREERLWSNEDLAPLLLRNAGWRPQQTRPLPRAFAEIVEHGDFERPVVLMRSTVAVGARGETHLWSFNQRRGPWEFDLQADPGLESAKTPGVESDMPRWLRGLGLLLRETAQTAPEQPDVLEPPDAERLKALGYVD